MPQELKPCPACGASVRLEGGDQWYNQNSFVIRCEDPTCGCIRVGDTERDECIRRWNSLPRAPHITPNDADCKGCPERRPGLEWTTEPPTVPGWYWQRVAGNERSCAMAWITIEDKKLRCESVWGNRQLTRFKGFEWGGPIPRPEEAV